MVVLAPAGIDGYAGTGVRTRDLGLWRRALRPLGHGADQARGKIAGVFMSSRRRCRIDEELGIDPTNSPGEVKRIGQCDKLLAGQKKASACSETRLLTCRVSYCAVNLEYDFSPQCAEELQF